MKSRMKTDFWNIIKPWYWIDSYISVTVTCCLIRWGSSSCFHSVMRLLYRRSGAVYSCEEPAAECWGWAQRDPCAGIHHCTDRPGGSSSMTSRPRCCSTVSWAPKTFQTSSPVQTSSPLRQEDSFKAMNRGLQTLDAIKENITFTLVEEFIYPNLLLEIKHQYIQVI